MSNRTLSGFNSDTPISVVTAIYGRHDDVPPIPAGFDEAILVSDRPIASDWKNVVLPIDLPPRLAAKLPRARPDLFSTNSASCWMDANVRDSSGYLSNLVRTTLVGAELAIFRHPKRKSVAEEIAFLKKFSKFRPLPLDEQVERYKSRGFTDDRGLFYTGVIARRHSERMANFGNAWLVEVAYGSVRDQVSFPYILTTTSLTVAVLGEDYRRHLDLVRHNRDDYRSFSAFEAFALRLEKLKLRRAVVH